MFHEFIAIDPGPKQSAWLYWSESGVTRQHGIVPNKELRSIIRARELPVVIEGVESFGMPVGRDVFETVFHSGRFAQIAPNHERIFRKQVKLTLCQNARAKDANIRQALLDRFGPSKQEAIGLKNTPGPLYGVKSHIWSALAVAVAYREIHMEQSCAA